MTLQAQKNISNAEYKKQSSNKFTVLDNTPQIKHAVEANKLQSDLEYKQQATRKTISSLDTPAMRHAFKANKLSSELEYKKDHKEDIKKGWEFIKDTPAQVFNE